MKRAVWHRAAAGMSRHRPAGMDFKMRKPVGAAAAAGAAAAVFVFGVEAAIHFMGMAPPPLCITLTERMLPGLAPMMLWIAGPLSAASTGAACGGFIALISRKLSPVEGALYALAPAALAVLVAARLHQGSVNGASAFYPLLPGALTLIWGACTAAMTPHMHVKHARELEISATATPTPPRRARAA